MRVTLKLATSLDGKIATASGESRWITGPKAREAVHGLRALHSAVLVGVETVIADDPELTVRVAGYAGAQPTRVVLDSRLRTPAECKLVSTARAVPTVIVTASSNERLTDAGVKVLHVREAEGRVDLAAALAELERMGVTALMVEGGGQVAASFLSQGLVDALEWFRAPIVLGDEGRPAVAAFVLKELSAAPRFRRVSCEAVGPDQWERYERL